jgi:hypothetical protein
MTVIGPGAKNFQRAMDRANSFNTGVRRMSQEDYQRALYSKKVNLGEYERLIYLNNYLDAV